MIPRPPGSVQQEIDSWGGFTSAYSYFARVEKWLPGQATQPQDLTENELRNDRLLMSDLLFHWWVTDGWSYNHGVRGARDAGGTTVEKGVPVGLSGLNQLYGDGRVAWKSGKAMNKSALSPTNPSIGMIKAYNTDATFY